MLKTPKKCTSACSHSKNMRRFILCKCKVCKGANHGVDYAAKLSVWERNMEEKKVLAAIELEREGVQARMRAAREVARFMARTIKEIRAAKRA